MVQLTRVFLIRIFKWLGIAFLLGFSPWLLAQNLEQQKQLSYQLTSPFQCIYHHSHHLKPENYNPALASITLAYVPGLTQEERLKRTVQLNQIFRGNGLYFDENNLPTQNDFQDTIRKKFIFIPFPEFPKIYLERIAANGRFIWLYSAETVSAIPELYRQTFPFAPESWLTYVGGTPRQRYGGLDYIQWIGLAVLLFFPIVFFKLFNRIMAFFLRRLVGRLTAEELQSRKIRRLARPISLFVTFLLLRRVVPFFQFPALWSFYLYFVIDVAIPVFALLMTLGIVDLLFVYIDKHINREKYGWYVQILPFFRTLLKIIAVTISLIFLLENLNLNVTALLAGLSIGGLAFALAAQDTIKNLFGSIMIFIDQPFRVGDWIVAEGIDGEVEEIGVRSTRIRTFYNSVLHVPNGKMADMTIDNLGMRVYRRYRTTLSLTYDTAPMALQLFRDGVLALIQRHPKTRKDNYAVRFLDFQAAALGLLVNVFFETDTFEEEWESREALNLQILALAERLGVHFAFPTQTLHIASFQREHISTDPASEAAMRKKLQDFLAQLS
ncbi:MAG: hypothetical protein OHK0053_36760 [Microscillaceae bacterium]